MGVEVWDVNIYEAFCFGRRHWRWGERCGAECGLFVTFVVVPDGVEQVE